MLNKILDSKIWGVFKQKEILVLIAFGIIYRFTLYTFLYNQTTMVSDSEGYLLLAKRISEFNLQAYNGERSLGYPILIALGFLSLKVVLFCQFAIGVVTSVLWYKMLINLNFSEKSSLWIALFLESFLNVYFYETDILVESLSLFFISVLFYFLSKGYFEKKSLKTELWMGFVLGYLVLIKPFYVFIPFVIYGFSVIKDFKIENLISKKAIIFVLPLISYFGWSYVNKMNTGYFVSTSFLGLNTAQNCVYFAEKCPKEYNWIALPYAKHREKSIREDKDVAMSIWSAYESGEYDYKHMSFPDFSNELGKYARTTIMMNPRAYLKQVFTKSWFDFWKTTIYFDAEKFNSKIGEKLFNDIWFLQRRIFNLFKFGFIFLIPFTCYKFLKTKKITQEVVIVTTVFLVSLLQGLVTYGTNSKNSFPFEFLMIVAILLFVKKEVRTIINRNK